VLTIAWSHHDGGLAVGQAVVAGLAAARVISSS